MVVFTGTVWCTTVFFSCLNSCPLLQSQTWELFWKQILFKTIAVWKVQIRIGKVPLYISEMPIFQRVPQNRTELYNNFLKENVDQVQNEGLNSAKSTIYFNTASTTVHTSTNIFPCLSLIRCSNWEFLFDLKWFKVIFQQGFNKFVTYNEWIPTFLVNRKCELNEVPCYHYEAEDSCYHHLQWCVQVCILKISQRVWDAMIKLLAQKALERTSTWEVIADNCGKKMREAMTASCAGEAK